MVSSRELPIAHRLQTIRECDRVLVLHHGVVHEHGTHEELLARRGIYYTLHELQFQDDAVAASLRGESELQEAESPPEIVIEWQELEEEEVMEDPKGPPQTSI